MIEKDAKRYNDFCHFIEGRSSFSPWLDEYDPFTEDGFAFVHAGSDDNGQFGLGDLDLYFKNKNFSYQDVLKKVQAYRDECKQSMDSDVPEEVEYVESLDELVGATQDWFDKSERRTRYTYDDDDRTAVVDGEVVDGGTSGKPWLWRLEDDDWFDWFAKPVVELNVRQVAIMAGVSDVDSVTEELCSISFMNDVELLYIEYYSNSGDEWAETRGIALTDEDMRNALRTMFDDAISEEDQAKLLAIAPTLVEQLDYTFPNGTVVGGTYGYSNASDRYPRDFVWKPEQTASEANEKTLRVYFCIEGTGDDTAELAVLVDDRDGDKVQAYSSEEEHVSAYIDYIEDECVPMRNPEDSIVYAMLSRVYADYDIVIVDKDSLKAQGNPRKTNNKRGESAIKFRSTQKRGKKSEASASEGARFFDSFIRARATEILDEYSVNDACSSGCEAWAEIGNGVEDVARFISDSVGALVKAWTTNLRDLNYCGNLDPKTAAEYDRLYDVAVSEYHSEYGNTAPEDTDEFYEYIDAYMGEGTDMFAEASVLLHRGRYGYELTGRISRSFDYVYGSSSSFKDDMSLKMVLTDEQLTEENAEAFLKEFESRIAEYQFSDGIKEYTLTAK